MEYNSSDIFIFCEYFFHLFFYITERCDTIMEDDHLSSSLELLGDSTPYDPLIPAGNDRIDRFFPRRRSREERYRLQT